MRSILISDLHLSPDRPDITRAFYGFLSGLPEDVGELFILGDLFEFWLGDDDPSHWSRAVVETIRSISASGIRTYFQAGNRDFLVGKDFAKQSGCKLLPDFQVLGIRGHQVLLTHGDLLCTDDIDYQKFRRRIQSPFMKWLATSLPLRARQWIVLKVRNKSKELNQNKADNIMDVNKDEVINKLTELDVSILIHGHTHRPAVHQIDIEGKDAKRFTLGDWDKNIWWIEVTDAEIKLISNPLNDKVSWDTD